MFFITEFNIMLVVLGCTQIISYLEGHLVVCLCQIEQIFFNQQYMIYISL